MARGLYRYRRLSVLLDDKNRKYSVLDVGCGGGDMLKEVSQWGKRKNLQLQST
jgi:2-polyprenyl-3-methyl-5-hydroxy-6-metoxy-1,4-benzoquinol methylase